MQSLTLPKHLTAIDCSYGKTYFKECTTEYAEQFRNAQFVSIDGVIVTGSTIKYIRNATGVEFFEVIVVPKLPQKQRQMFFDLRDNLTDKQLQNLKLEQILAYIELKNKEEEYYNTKPLSEEELARRREQVKNRPRLHLA